MRRAFVVLAPWAALLVDACSKDSPQAMTGVGGAAAGTSTVAGSSGIGNGGTSSSAGSASSGASTGGSATVAGNGGGDGDSALHLALFNTVTDKVEPGFEPLPQVLKRVELPPRFTLQALVPDDAQSVRFTVDGEATLDKAAPFRLTEDAAGKAMAWAAKFGSHTVKLESFGTADGTGAASHESTLTVELSSEGMDAAFVPTAQGSNDAWVTAHLEEVMVAKTFTGTVGTLPYRLYTPEHYVDSVAYPVLIYLHGRGQRGTSNQGTYTSRLFHGPQSIVSPNSQQVFPSFVIVPQCSDMPSNQEWAHWIGGLGSDGSYMQHAEPWPSAQLVKELLESLSQTLSLEPARVYLTGESMGGFGTWEFTTRWPELFAVGVPMAGYSDRSKVDRILDIPFWVFHGGADQTNPVAGSRAMVKAIQDAGGSAKYTEYPGVDHGGTFDKAWNEEQELLPFIFSQRKSN